MQYECVCKQRFFRARDPLKCVIPSKAFSVPCKCLVLLDLITRKRSYSLFLTEYSKCNKKKYQIKIRCSCNTSSPSGIPAHFSHLKRAITRHYGTLCLSFRLHALSAPLLHVFGFTSCFRHWFTAPPIKLIC